MSTVALLFVAGVLGCYGSGGTTVPSAGGHLTTVRMASSAFTPTPDTVSAGATVTWSNQDGYTHTVTSVPGSAEMFAASVPGTASTTHTFNTPGTYNYYCSIHGTPTSGMRGTIVVK